MGRVATSGSRRYENSLFLSDLHDERDGHRETLSNRISQGASKTELRNKEGKSSLRNHERDNISPVDRDIIQAIPGLQ